MHPEAPSRLAAVTIASAIGALLWLQPALARQEPSQMMRIPGQRRVLRAGPGTPRSFVRPQPASLRARGLQANAAVVNVNYFGFTPEAQAAFQYAIDLWKTQVTSQVPITINATFEPLGTNVLGQAGATNFYRDFPNAPQARTWYPVALANKLAGADLDPPDPVDPTNFPGVDIAASFSSTFGWYYGLDGAAPAGTYDFVTVVMHEIGHGLGFLGSGTVSESGLGTWGFGTTVPSIYDRFVVDGGGSAMLNTTLFPRSSLQLAGFLTSDGVYWSGANGIGANNGVQPRLYAPATWTAGSSFSHLDEATYPPRDENSMMTPMLASTEAIHDPGPIVRGMFADMGWEIASACTYSVSPSSADLAAGGGTGSFTLTTEDGCAWTATSSSSWITVTSAASGTGSSAITYTVAAQNSSVARAGQITVGDQAFTVTQAGVACSYGISPASTWISARGGTRTLGITASAGDCRWSLMATPAWITLAGSVSGSGNATATYSVAPNPGSPARGGVVLLISSSNANVGIAAITQTAAGLTAPVDFDGNGLGDAFLYDPATGAWRIVENTAPQTVTEVASGTWATGWAITPADFNGDALTDLFLYNATNGLFFKALSLGNGQFSFFGYRWAPSWVPTVVDLNGDGLSDVFLYNQATGAWFRCTSASGASDFTYVGGAWAPGWRIAPADFNGDGLGDLFLYNTNAGNDGNSGRWFRVMSAADGTFQYVAGDVRWANDWQVTPADFDGDGRTDLFLYRSDGQWFQVYFTATGASYVGGLWARGWTIEAGDFNGDSRTDLFLYNRSNAQYFVAQSGAARDFSYYQGGLRWGPGWEVSLTDFNGDGISDVLLYNRVNGAWAQATTILPALFSYAYGNFGPGLTVVGSTR